MLPQDEGPDGADQRLGQVQHDLEQDEERERTGHRLAAADSLVGEGASDGVVRGQRAHAVLCQLLTAEAAVLGVVVAGEGHDQHRDHQADDAKDEVQELQRAENKSECVFSGLYLRLLWPEGFCV